MGGICHEAAGSNVQADAEVLVFVRDLLYHLLATYHDLSFDRAVTLFVCLDHCQYAVSIGTGCGYIGHFSLGIRLLSVPVAVGGNQLAHDGFFYRESVHIEYADGDFLARFVAERLYYGGVC